MDSEVPALNVEGIGQVVLALEVLQRCKSVLLCLSWLLGLLIRLINREELLDNIMSVSEVRVVLLQPQLDVHVVILVVRQAEAITLECISIAHPSIAKVDLRALGKAIGGK